MLVTVQEDKGDPFVNHGSIFAASSSDAASASTAATSTLSFQPKPKGFAVKLDRIEEPLGQQGGADED